MDDFEEVDHPGAVDTLFQATPPLHQVKMSNQTNKIVKLNEQGRRNSIISGEALKKK